MDGNYDHNGRLTIFYYSCHIFPYRYIPDRYIPGIPGNVPIRGCTYRYVMLLITLIALLLAIPLSSYTTNSHGSYNTISATLFTRITAIAMLYAAALSYSSASVLSLDAGLGLFSGLIHATTITQNMEVFLLITGALILIP
jgi:hypothetical protein